MYSVLTKPGSIQLYASGIWCLITIMIKWHRGQWIQDMYIQSQNVRRLYVLPRPQSSQMTDRHTTTENQNKYVTFIYLKKARQLKYQSHNIVCSHSSPPWEDCTRRAGRLQRVRCRCGGASTSSRPRGSGLDYQIIKLHWIPNNAKR